MSALNIWRIPLLFLVSGMGVRFALERRNGKQLLQERARRILVPLTFGFFFVCPICAFFTLLYYKQPLAYYPNTAHLWFLVNLIVYTVVSLPLLLFLKNHSETGLLRFIRKIVATPWSLPLLGLPFIIESVLLRPLYFSSFVNSWHGFWYGWIAFLTGFLMTISGGDFRKNSERGRHGFIVIAFLFFLYRTLAPAPDPSRAALLALESFFWILAVQGYASRHFDKPSRFLTFLSPRVFPLYILHLPVQYGFSLLILPLNTSATLKFVTLITLTLGTSLLLTLLLERVSFLRPLFGMTSHPKSPEQKNPLERTKEA